MGWVTSVDAYKFAKDIIQDRNQGLWGKFNDENNTAKSAALSKLGFKNKTPVPSDPLRKVCDIDYGKFEALEKNISEEEAKEQAAKDREAESYRRAIEGCAHDRSQERQIYERPTADKLAAANRFRFEGNKSYKDKNYSLAAVFYRKALIQLDYTFPDSNEDTQKFNSEKLAAHLNLAACKLIQKDWDEALTQCRLALDIDPENMKAYYRRGVIYTSLDEFELAEVALNSALKFSNGDAQVISALKDLEKKRTQYNLKARKVMSAMFESSVTQEDKQN